MIGNAHIAYAKGEFDEVGKTMYCFAILKKPKNFSFIMQARKLLSEVVRHSPKIPDPYESLGNILEELGETENAIAMYTAAAVLQKTDPQRWLKLGLKFK